MPVTQVLQQIKLPVQPPLSDGVEPQTYREDRSESIHVGKYVICTSIKFGATTVCAAFDGSGTSAVPISAQSIPAHRYKRFLQQEGRVWLRLRQHPHKNLPRLLGCHDPPASTDGDQPGFLFFNPFYGDLYDDCIRQRFRLVASSKTQDVNIFRILKQMVAAVDHCHRQRIVIGNLKLGKFMWADAAHQTLQLAELDGARLLSPEQTRVERTIVCPAYVAPEVLDSESYDGFAADIWALGVVAYVLATGSYPYRDSQTSELFNKIKTECVEYPGFLSNRTVDLLQSMLTLDPSDRATAEELMQMMAVTHKEITTPHSDAQNLVSTKTMRTRDISPSMVDYEAATADASTRLTCAERTASRSATTSPYPQASAVVREEAQYVTKRATGSPAACEPLDSTTVLRARSLKRISWTAGLDDDSYLQALPTEKRRNSITSM
eukprot:m.295373 g.295373  ORF g.295373 m.295373 type:complete len:436 (-) comp20038_c0_seq1:1211-2518(-)